MEQVHSVHGQEAKERRKRDPSSPNLIRVMSLVTKGAPTRTHPSRFCSLPSRSTTLETEPLTCVSFRVNQDPNDSISLKDCSPASKAEQLTRLLVCLPLGSLRQSSENPTWRTEKAAAKGDLGLNFEEKEIVSEAGSQRGVLPVHSHCACVCSVYWGLRQYAQHCSR